MAECDASGKTRKEFALERGLNYSTFIYWHTHLKKKVKVHRSSKPLCLKPVDTEPLFSAKDTKSAPAVEIMIGSITVRLYRDR